MGRRVLTGPNGAPVATYDDRPETGELLAAELRRAEDASVEAFVDAALRGLAGRLVETRDPALTAALQAAGATLVREAELMTLDLEAERADAVAQQPHRPPHAPAGVSIHPFAGWELEELGDVSVAAHPPGHPDHLTTEPARAAADLRAQLVGSAEWGRLGASRVAHAPGGRLVGAAVLARRVEAPPGGGPWLCELFRQPGPEWRGVGAALLDAMLGAARTDGLPTVGLVVSRGNPARALYATRGFVVRWPFALLRLPPG